MKLWNPFRSKPEVRFITGAQLAPFDGMSANWTGIQVSETAALGISALWCGIATISEQIGALPLVTYEHQDDGGKLVATDHPNYRLLARRPNPEMTRAVFWETFMSHCLLYGNGYAEIVPAQSGAKGAELWPIHPTRVQVLRDTVTKMLSYRVTELDGTQSVLSAADVLHVPGLGYDGSIGFRLLTIARETIAFGLATQKYANSLYRNLNRPGGVIEVPPGVSLDDTGLKNLARAFRADTSAENVGSTPILEEGIRFNKFDLSTNEQLQFKELQQFYVYEIARLLRIPPSKLQSLEKASFASLTEQNREFLSCLNPWLEKLESEIERKLFTDVELDTYYVEFDTDQLTKSDQNARYTAYQSALSAGWMSVNEVRAAEGMASIGPDGDDYGTSTQTMPVAQPYPTVDPLADANPTPEGNPDVE